jgi:hypothetical protein
VWYAFWWVEVKIRAMKLGVPIKTGKSVTTPMGHMASSNSLFHGVSTFYFTN